WIVIGTVLNGSCCLVMLVTYVALHPSGLASFCIRYCLVGHVCCLWSESAVVCCLSEFVVCCLSELLLCLLSAVCFLLLYALVHLRIYVIVCYAPAWSVCYCLPGLLFVYLCSDLSAIEFVFVCCFSSISVQISLLLSVCLHLFDF
ncbi:hypothetical protein Tco_0901250, partial [Tanacetum coccineum]